MKVLITGIGGFVGQYLNDYISQNHPEVEIHGTVFSNAHIDRTIFADNKFISHVCDINDKEKVRELINLVRPDIVFHLAAQSYVSSSWENPENTLHTNIIGQSNLFEAVRQLRDEKFDPVILIACSSEEYGPAIEIGHPPFTEASELRPKSPYAISKIAQDFMGFQYFQAYGLKIIRIRAFNHTGPGRDPVFGVSNFAKKIADIEKGLIPSEIKTRDLGALRDFTDVRDIVRGYWLAIEKCQPGEVYNLCSSRGITFEQILNKLLALSAVKNISLIKDPEGKRPTDGGQIIGDNAKFKNTTGWQVEIDFLEQTVPDMLNFWRSK